MREDDASTRTDCLIQASQMPQRGDVAIEAEAGDEPEAGIRGHRMPADGFAFVNITDMHFDHRQVGARECVAQGEAGVGERTGVDNQAEDLAVGKFIIDLIDDETLVIALVELHVHAQGGRLFDQQIFQIGQGLVAVGCRLALAEAIEVGAVDDDDSFHG